MVMFVVVDVYLQKPTGFVLRLGLRLPFARLFLSILQNLKREQSGGVYVDSSVISLMCSCF